MPPAARAKVVEEATQSISQNEAFLQHLQQVRAPREACRVPLLQAHRTSCLAAFLDSI